MSKTINTIRLTQNLTPGYSEEVERQIRTTYPGKPMLPILDRLERSAATASLLAIGANIGIIMAKW
jgi:hypothetical protein